LPRLRRTGRLDDCVPRGSRKAARRGKDEGGSLFFDCLLDANPPSPRGYGVAGVREFNPRYAEAEGALLGQFRHLHTDIYGNPPSPKGYGGTGREFVEHLRNRGKFFDHKSERTGWEWFASRGSAKTSDYAAAMKLEERTARRHLKHFLKLGLVKRTGASTSTEYEIK